MSLGVSASEDFARPSVLTKASVQSSRSFDKLVPHNSAIAVVRKGNCYRASLGQREGSAVTPSVYWVGIVPA
ncbi:MAG TPA: hypothetical protein VGH36_12405 [Acetobacteraceae bacterium]